MAQQNRPPKIFVEVNFSVKIWAAFDVLTSSESGERIKATRTVSGEVSKGIGYLEIFRISKAEKFAIT